MTLKMSKFSSKFLAHIIRVIRGPWEEVTICENNEPSLGAQEEMVTQQIAETEIKDAKMRNQMSDNKSQLDILLYQHYNVSSICLINSTSGLIKFKCKFPTTNTMHRFYTPPNKCSFRLSNTTAISASRGNISTTITDVYRLQNNDEDPRCVLSPNPACIINQA